MCAERQCLPTHVRIAQTRATGRHLARPGVHTRRRSRRENRLLSARCDRGPEPHHVRPRFSEATHMPATTGSERQRREFTGPLCARVSCGCESRHRTRIYTATRKSTPFLTDEFGGVFGHIFGTHRGISVFVTRFGVLAPDKPYTALFVPGMCVRVTRACNFRTHHPSSVISSASFREKLKGS